MVQLLARIEGLSVRGFFLVNRKIFPSLLGFFLTYLVLLVEFRVDEKEGEGKMTTSPVSVAPVANATVDGIVGNLTTTALEATFNTTTPFFNSSLSDAASVASTMMATAAEAAVTTTTAAALFPSSSDGAVENP